MPGFGSEASAQRPAACSAPRDRAASFALIGNKFGIEVPALARSVCTTNGNYNVAFIVIFI